MSIASALSTLRAARDSIRTAIVGKGGTLPEGSPMSAYPDAIEALPSGGGGGPVELTYTGIYLQTVLTDEIIANWDLDTSQGTNFNNMFDGCSNLTSVPQLDTSKGTNFGYMFRGCSSLTTIPQLDTSKGTTFYSMFYGCSSLMTIPQLDTSQGTNFGDMFRGCTNLTTIPQLDTSKNRYFNYMFNGCSNLTSVPMMDTSQGTNFGYMFNGCTILTTVPQMDTSKGTTFNAMFNGCSSLTQIGIYGFTRSISISGCKLDADNINAFFMQAGEAYDGTQTINITRNPGADTCDKTIATDKGWTVTG